jgi:hypothetical protein
VGLDGAIGRIEASLASNPYWFRAADGETYRGSHRTDGFTVLELPTREDAVKWPRQMAVACSCSQELRELMCDPAS